MIRNYTLSNFDGILNSEVYCEFPEVFKKDKVEEIVQKVEGRTKYIRIFDMKNVAVVFREDYLDDNTFSKKNLSMIGSETYFDKAEEEIKLRGFKLERLI